MRKGSAQKPLSYLAYLQCYLPLIIYFFHYECLSGPYLWKYNNDWNETLFINRWQWEGVPSTKIILLACIFTELSPVNHVFIVTVCPGHILESTKGIELGLYIDSSERKCLAQEPYFYSVYWQSNLPLTFVHSGCLSRPYLVN